MYYMDRIGKENNMSLEPGGRSDKYGNKYENRYFAKLLLQLVKENLTWVIVEPLGLYQDSAEFITEQKDTAIQYYQCKASNKTQQSWSIADLQRYNVFSRAKEIILNEHNNHYYFISPLQYNELDELCKRARTNASSDDFVQYQLTNEKLRKLFKKCAIAFGYDTTNSVDVERLVYILSHCHFEQYTFGIETEQVLEEQISILFTGKSTTVRSMLENYANDTNHYGRKITAKDVIDYLKNNNIYTRDYRYDNRILSQITMLNNTHWDEYHAIFNNLVHRSATENIIKNIQEGYSVIIHGKAGSGKSGCLQELIHYLNDSHILYLALKLDKHIPTSTSDIYGKQLGLPESPIHCLATIAAGKPCVLILDQLDALRWNGNHSGEALSVCKEFILQADAINKYSGGKISIVFASRTFDLENDAGLKNLFVSKESERHVSLNWLKVNVDFFTVEDVVKIIGESYNGLSQRLKKLLLTPSSLYVWSKLEEKDRANSIFSVLDLMNKWWKQIQAHCELSGILSSDTITCKSKIVESMETRNVFSLPASLLADYQKIIDSFVSNGLLNYNINMQSISFTHQSFLDYFIISGIINKIYSGSDLKDLIGKIDDQTPLIRYRVLSVLQNLIESDQAVFIDQSIKLLNCNTVRYYFKCTVFEIIGQYESPEAKIFEIVDSYKEKPEWSDYIHQVVFYGHLPYVLHFMKSHQGWFSDSELWLLKSISHKAPDFVTETVLPFAFLDKERDHKIFRVLCHDANDDSENMFQFRCQLLKKDPTLFQYFWRIPELIKKQSTHIVDIFDILLENWQMNIDTHFFVTEWEKWSIYANRHYKLIVNRLFPKICDVTQNYQPKWPDDRIDTKFREWIKYTCNNSAVRKIVEIVKLAFQAYAQAEPEWMIKFIQNQNMKYPISAIGHELIMHALTYLPVEHSDAIIQWLLTDFDTKIFVFSANEEDYLCYTKQILKKFSSNCNAELFHCLEETICTWQESAKQMVQIYKHRLEVNHNHKYKSVYYAYWGHLQKELLPSIDYLRLSGYSKSLIDVLNRNKWIHLPHFYSGFICGPTKTVISPIEGYTNHLSDKNWIQIISTPQEKMNQHWRENNNGINYVEATHNTFASSLSIQAKREPERFARLSLYFPIECYHGYICNVLYALSDCQEPQFANVDLMSEVIRRFRNIDDQNVIIAIARVIKNHANQDWPYDILEFISKIALNYRSSQNDNDSITNSTEPKYISAYTLLQHSINCVRGCALDAIASLIWKQKHLGRYFQKIIELASKDTNDAVRCAVMFCVLSYYNIDRKFSFKIFQTLVSKDLRVIFVPGCWEILNLEYNNHVDFVRETIEKANLSKIEDLAEQASGFLCAIAIFYGDQCAFEFITSHELSYKQKERICQQAVSSYNMDEYHEISEKILLYLIDSTSQELLGLNRLFLDRSISIHRDANFLIHLMGSQQRIHLLHWFLEYLYKSDEDICKYASVFETIGNGLSQISTEGNNYFIIDDFIKCVVRLFDRGHTQCSIRTICLNIWDQLFMSNLQNIKPLSDMIDSFE